MCLNSNLPFFSEKSQNGIGRSQARSVCSSMFDDTFPGDTPLTGVSGRFSVGLGLGARADLPKAGSPLANRGDTFPEPLGGGNGDPLLASSLSKTKYETRAVSEIRNSSASAWRLKSQIGRLLRTHAPKENGRGYSVCACGYAGKMRGDDGRIESIPSVSLFRKKDSKVMVSGAFRCNSSWLCPTCAMKRTIERKERVESLINATVKKGGHVAFVTLTVRHTLEMPLADVKDLLLKSSRAARQGRKWTQEIQPLGGIYGVVQGVEVLHNIHTGWNFHAHLVVPCAGGKKASRDAMRLFVNEFMAQVEKRGGTALRVGQSIDIVGNTNRDRVKVASYASKGSAAWEIAGGLKDVRSRESRSPWDIAQLANAGDTENIRLFVEYSKAIVGTKSCVISKSLADKLGIEAHDDKEVEGVEGEPDENDDGAELVVVVPTPKWHKLLNYGVAWQVIQSVETGQNTAVVQAVIDSLIGEVAEKERQEALAEKARAEQRAVEQTIIVDPAKMAAQIYHMRRVGYSWDKARSWVETDLRKSATYQRRRISFPSSEEIGRELSRIGERYWDA